MMLPIDYENNMKQLLANLGNDEFTKYIESFLAQRVCGLRINTLKISVADFLKISPFNLDVIPWTKDGFYYNNGYPGRHSFYHAGLYYIQEPSAMYPAASLKPQPGDKVLDVCAAPGGKSVQIAAQLKGEGLLVSNDINEERVRALVKNIEMAGIKNCIITNDTPANLKKRFEGYFDKILVDAPCSGEGMFRKDEDAIKSWENFKSDKCREMQDDILDNINFMLKPGGLLIYSTCTFTPHENEETIHDFLKRFPYYTLEELPKIAGIADALPVYADGDENFKKAARLWPQRIRGEGHFTALLRKNEDCEFVEKYKKILSYKVSNEIPEVLIEFHKKNLKVAPWEGFYCMMGDNVYYLPVEPPCLDNIKVARLGLFVGTIKGNVLKPSHPYILALPCDAFLRVLDLQPDDMNLQKYLRGDTLVCSEEQLPDNGLIAIRTSGYTVGMGLAQNGIVKNLYPKGWRRMS